MEQLKLFDTIPQCDVDFWNKMCREVAKRFFSSKELHKITKFRKKYKLEGWYEVCTDGTQTVVKYY